MEFNKIPFTKRGPAQFDQGENRDKESQAIHFMNKVFMRFNQKV